MINTIHSFDISKREWQSFLDRFTKKHSGVPVQMETVDRETGEDVVMPEATLSSLTLDLEDFKNPRINVTVKLDNKEIRHILFLPSRVSLHVSRKNGDEALTIDSVNTETTIYLRTETLADFIEPAA